MKNSARYARKVKKLLSGARAPGPEERPEPIRLLVRAVLAEDATARQAEAAMAAVAEEFLDFNELRIAPIKDVVECLGRDYPQARRKADMLNSALRGVFEQSNALSLDFLGQETKREVRRFLRERLGLSLYAESVLTLRAFEGHAIPVDALLLEALKMGGYIDAGSDLPDLQGFLERITPAKDDLAAHEALRRYADRTAPKVFREWARREKAAREAREKAEAEARAKAEAKAKAEAEAKAKAEAEAKARKKARAKAARKKKKAGAAPAKKPARKKKKKAARAGTAAKRKK